MVDRVQARGMPLDRNEVKLRNRLENVCERLNRPTEFKARLNELIALQRMHVRRDVTRFGRAGCATPRGGALRVAARSRGCAHKPPTAVYTAPVPRVAYRVSGGALARPSRAATCEPCWMCVVADPRLPPPLPLPFTRISRAASHRCAVCGCLLTPSAAAPAPQGPTPGASSPHAHRAKGRARHRHHAATSQGAGHGISGGGDAATTQRPCRCIVTQQPVVASCSGAGAYAYVPACRILNLVL